MVGILDSIPGGLILECHDDWPRSSSRQEWFAITRRIVQDTISDMDLDPAALAEWKRHLSELACFDPQARYCQREEATP